MSGFNSVLLQESMKNISSIRQATIHDSNLLTEIAKASFLESHGHSASEVDIESYVNEKFTDQVFQNELKDEKNIYNLIYYHETPAGYSKIILNSKGPNLPTENLTKLERLYLLKSFYGLGLGKTLFDMNVDFSKAKNQLGMWLYVWKENERAIQFYNQNGFEIIGSYDFKISHRHSNPNHQMLLNY